MAGETQRSPQAIHAEWRTHHAILSADSSNEAARRGIRRLHQEASQLAQTDVLPFRQFAQDTLGIFAAADAAGDIETVRRLDTELRHSPALIPGVLALQQDGSTLEGGAIEGRLDQPQGKVISISERAEAPTLSGTQEAFGIILDDLEAHRSGRRKDHDNTAMGKVQVALGLDGGPHGGKVMTGPEAMQTLEIALRVMMQRHTNGTATGEEQILLQRIQEAVKAHVAEPIRQLLQSRRLSVSSATIDAMFDELIRLGPPLGINVYDEFCRRMEKTSQREVGLGSRAGVLAEWRKTHKDDPAPTKDYLVSIGHTHGYDLPHTQQADDAVTEKSQDAPTTPERIIPLFTRAEMTALYSMIHTHGNFGEGMQIVFPGAPDLSPITFLVDPQEIDLRALGRVLTSSPDHDVTHGTNSDLRRAAREKLTLVLANDEYLFAQNISLPGLSEDEVQKFNEGVQLLLIFLQGKAKQMGGVTYLCQFLSSDTPTMHYALSRLGGKSPVMLESSSVDYTWPAPAKMIEAIRAAQAAQ